MIVQRPDGTFGAATDPTISFASTGSPIIPQDSTFQEQPTVGGDQELQRHGPTSGTYSHTHQTGSHTGSTQINYNKPSNHLGGGSGGDGGEREPNGEFQFTHQHVSPSGTTSVNFNYNGIGGTNTQNGGGGGLSLSFFSFNTY